MSKKVVKDMSNVDILETVKDRNTTPTSLKLKARLKQ